MAVSDRRHSASRLGTDGCASNNGLDLFREMDMLAKTQKTRTGSPTAMTARDVLSCATISGAQAVGVPDCGTIYPGCCADLIIVNTRSAHLVPFYSQDILVYAASGSDVDTVIINGEVVVRDKQLLAFDLEEVYLEQVRELIRD